VSVPFVIQHVKSTALLYCHLWPSLLYHIFPHYVINGPTCGGKTLLHTKVCCGFCYLFFSDSFTYIFIWVRKLDSNGLTKTKNWSGRNEVTETSGMLHPLWPQNKWLHKSRTTDYKHTRQDRWIQTELAFTLAKNATKPNPFEIIPLQITRKENNWKTEEALARAAVTLETERVKGSNPWCLWWWWWGNRKKEGGGGVFKIKKN